MDFYDIPNDILSTILFEHLSIKDIQSCNLSSKIFHVLNNYQKDIISNAKKWMDKMY